MSSSTYSMDQLTEVYGIFLDNSNTEDTLNENEKSSASQFGVTMTPMLNMSPLLFMKSVQAETMLEKLEISSLPLTFSRREAIKIYVNIPSSFVQSNAFLNYNEIKTVNETPKLLPLEDFICRTPEQVVDFVNDTLRHRVNYYIICRYLNAAFDGDILDTKSESTFSLNDIKLLQRWIDLCLWTRQVFHQKLCLLTNNTEDDISNLITFSNSPELFSARTEQSYIADSSCIKAPEDRMTSEKGHRTSFDQFHGIDVTKSLDSSRDLPGIKKTEETKIMNWLSDIQFDITKPFTDPDDIEGLNDCIQSNKDLIDLAITARRMLNLEKTKLDKRSRIKSIFEQEICVLTLDLSKEKCKFTISPDQFLAPDTSLTISLPELMSYSL